MAINPILRGMNPDPSICTDGKAYYIATSTFEWYPGIKIYKSTDLANWNLVDRPLTKRQIDLRGVPDSAGVWAPGIRYINGQFWLTYSVMHQINGVYKDLCNYLITAKEVTDQWSNPIYIGSQGFDPSLFCDDDGRFYILCQNWDYRRTYTHQAFNGVLLQEYDPKIKALIAQPKTIFKGSAQGGTEGPNLIKHEGYYYLLMAEGGSGRHHAVTVARSMSLYGPYCLSPHVNLITAYNAPYQPLQKAGHGNLVTGPDKKDYLVHLVSRYLPGTEYSVLGRETAIEPISWQFGWPTLEGGGNVPKQVVNDLPINPQVTHYETDFKTELGLEWSTLRKPNDYEFGKGLILHGDESLSSMFSQALVARPWPAFSFTATTNLIFDPRSFRDQAGLALYYNTRNWLFLYMSEDDLSNRRILNLQIAKHGKITEPTNGLYIYLPVKGNVELKFVVKAAQVQSYYRTSEVWHPFGRQINVSYLSDEGIDGWGFTGAQIGLTAIDTDCKTNLANFLQFTLDWHDDLTEKTDE